MMVLEQFLVGDGTQEMIADGIGADVFLAEAVLDLPRLQRNLACILVADEREHEREHGGNHDHHHPGVRDETARPMDVMDRTPGKALIAFSLPCLICKSSFSCW